MDGFVIDGFRRRNAKMKSSSAMTAQVACRFAAQQAREI